MSGRFLRKKVLFSTLLSALFLLSAGCFYTLTLDPPYPLKIDPKDHQPLALFPIPDASGQPGSGSNLYSFIRDSLQKKGYFLVSQDDVAEALEELKVTPLLLLSDEESLPKMGDRLKAKLLMIGTLPQLKVKKSYWDAQTFQVGEREPSGYQSLPTYHGGTTQIRMILRMFESEKGSLVWAAEGTLSGQIDSAEAYGQKLAERLLNGLPAVPTLPKEKAQ